MRTRSILVAITLASAGTASVAAPPTGGTIAIETGAIETGAIEAGAADPAMRPFIDAASAALTARGFTVLDDPAHAASVLTLRTSRSDVGTGLGRVSGQQKPMLNGIGAVLPLSTGRSDLTRLQRTRLELRIRRRGGAATEWTGAAVTVRESGTKAGGDAAVATALTDALLRPYPAEPKGIVGVP